MQRVLITVILGGFTIGCSGSGSDGPPEPVFPVTGVVTFDGAPVVGADITFHSTDGERSAFGRTNDAGEYQLTTFSSNDGAVAGKYVVTIMKTTSSEPETPEADTESEDYVPPGLGEPAPVEQPQKSELPERYGDQATSGLMAVVQESDTNKLDFALEK